MHLRRNVFAVALVVTMATLIPSGANPMASSGSSDYDITLSEGGQFRVFTVGDNDGRRHEEIHEWFGGSGAFLGVRLDDESEEDGGAVIERVIAETPAADAGLRDGDIIIGIDGRTVDRAADVIRRIHEQKPGDRIDIEIDRDGLTRTISVELGQREGRHLSFNLGDFDGEEFSEQFRERFGERMRELGERLGRDFAFGFDGEHEHFDAEELQERMRELGERLGNLDLDIDIPEFDGGHGFSVGIARPKLGVQLVATTPELRRHLGGSEDAGVLVSKVLPDTPAETAGVRVGDLIVAVDAEPVKSADELIEALSERSGESIELEVVRDGRTLRLDVDLEEDITPVRDRASLGGNAFFPDVGQAVDVAETTRAAAQAIRQAVLASTAQRNAAIQSAVRQYRRALAPTFDLSDTY